jgi:hypothetical protein
MRTKVLVVLSMAMGVLGGGLPAQAQTQCTTKIAAVPFTIVASGNYCFDKHLATAATAAATANAITINADYVTLDLNGFKLDGSAAAPGTRKGIYAANRKGIVIRNGVIRGFARGVSLEGTGSSHVIEELRVEQSAATGIWLEGSGVVVRGCKVTATSPLTPDTSVEGIRVAGSEARVLNNDVLDTLATGSGVARSIVLQGASSSIVESNRVGNASLTPGTTGIAIVSASDLLLSSNSFSTLDHGLVFDTESFGRYRDNLTSGVSNPYSGGEDAGNNQ